MTNLLPEKEKQKLQREYRYRVVAFGLLCVFVLGIFSFIGLLPPFFIISAQKNIVQEQKAVAMSHKATEKEKSLLSNVDEVRTRLKLAAAWLDEPSVSKLLRVVLAKERFGVSLIRIDYHFGSKDFTVSGNAQSREALVRFKNTLAMSGIFDDIKLPLSDLAKKEDIAFTIQARILEPVQ